MDEPGPNLLRHVFPSYRVPRLGFPEAGLPTHLPAAARCIDTTLGQGRAVLAAPDPGQLARLHRLLAELDARAGLLRGLELRLRDRADRELVAAALEEHTRGENPLAPTVSLPASAETLALLEGLPLREAGLALPASDYLVAGGGRAALAEELPALLDLCLEQGIQPRLDLLDVTRADLRPLLPILERSLGHVTGRGARLRLRLVDSFGLGLPFAEAPLPRSVPRLLAELRERFGLQPGDLEFEAHDDLGLALATSLAAWLHGAGGLVGSLGGVGERAGLAPLELLLLHLAGCYGSDCELARVTDLYALLAPLGLRLSPRHPLFGEEALRAEQTLPGELQGPFDTFRVLGLAQRGR